MWLGSQHVQWTRVSSRPHLKEAVEGEVTTQNHAEHQVLSPLADGVMTPMVTLTTTKVKLADRVPVGTMSTTVPILVMDMAVIVTGVGAREPALSDPTMAIMCPLMK